MKDESHGAGTAWWVCDESGGSVHNCKKRGCKSRHVRKDRLATVSDRTRWRVKLDKSWRPTTLAVVIWNKKSRSLLAYVADLARDQHRRGGRVFMTFPWNSNVLTTWPIQSLLAEAPFLCIRERKKRFLTNCADTARLIGRSRCCQSPFCSTFGAVLPRKCVCVT